MTASGDDQEHKRVRTVLDEVAEANDKRYSEWLKTRGKPVWKTTTVDAPEAVIESHHWLDGRVVPGARPDTDPRIENSGKPLRIRGMIEGGKLYEPGEKPDED